MFSVHPLQTSSFLSCPICFSNIKHATISPRPNQEKKTDRPQIYIFINNCCNMYFDDIFYVGFSHRHKPSLAKNRKDATFECGCPTLSFNNQCSILRDFQVHSMWHNRLYIPLENKAKATAGNQQE